MTNLNADQFESMVKAGVFGDRRAYLWGGKVCEKRPRSIARAFVAARISEAVRSLLPADWESWHDNPIRLGRKHIPLPDFAVIRGPLERYRNRKPGPADVGLVIEVAVTSLTADLGKRAARYARAGVPRYWVADAVNRRIIEHVDPRVVGKSASYDAVVDRPASDEIELSLDGQFIGRIALSRIF